MYLQKQMVAFVHIYLEAPVNCPPVDGIRVGLDVITGWIPHCLRTARAGEAWRFHRHRQMLNENGITCLPDTEP